MVNLEKDFGYKSSWPLTQVNIRIKIVIIVVLKPDSGI